MADIKWIKITTDMFDNRKIKHLRKLPEGNNIVLIWVMLLTMAGRCNSGGLIFLTENIPYTPKMLADELDFEENTVLLALKALEEFNMIITDQGFFTIAGWEEYQNVEGMDKIREQTRQRVAKHRENQKQKLLGASDVTLHVTQCNATDIDKEEDIDKERDKENISTIVSYLNEKAGTNYKATTKKTQEKIKARLAEGFTVDNFKTVIDKMCAEWIGDEKMERFLRPETLFGPKFENYLNAKVTRKEGTTNAKHVGSNTGANAEIERGIGWNRVL